MHKTAELLEAVVDFELPGFGIIYRPRKETDPFKIHRSHGRLLLHAIKLIMPAIYSDNHLHNYDMEDYGFKSLVHDDEQGLHDLGQDFISMTLRLHTESKASGADVLMSNTAPGNFARQGDRTLYALDGTVAYGVATKICGYDGQDRLSPTKYFHPAEKGTYNPLYSEPELYHFRQNPLSSVVFRSSTTMGPTSAHGFESLRADQMRLADTSDLRIYSQSI